MHTTNFKFQQLPQVPPLEISPFRHFLFWVVRNVRAQEQSLDPDMASRHIKQGLAQYLLDPIYTCLSDQLQAIPEVLPEPVHQEPYSESLMLLRQPQIFWNICLVRARGARATQIVEYVNSTFRKCRVTPDIIENLLYFFFDIPDVVTGCHKEIIALLYYLKHYSDKTHLHELSQVLSGAMPEHIFLSITGQVSDLTPINENIKKILSIGLNQIAYDVSNNNYNPKETLYIMKDLFSMYQRFQSDQQLPQDSEHLELPEKTKECSPRHALPAHNKKSA